MNLVLPPFVQQHLFWFVVGGYLLLTVYQQAPKPGAPWTRATLYTWLYNVAGSLAARETHPMPPAPSVPANQ
jgi:hypothetical protein